MKLCKSGLRRRLSKTTAFSAISPRGFQDTVRVQSAPAHGRHSLSGTTDIGVPLNYHLRANAIDRVRKSHRRDDSPGSPSNSPISSRVQQPER